MEPCVEARPLCPPGIREEMEARMNSPAWQRVAEIETMLASMPQVELPVKHRFTPGLYAREIFMPAGTVLTSKIHITEHMFVVSQGSALVWTEEQGVMTVKAPHTGVTPAGTRRVLYILEDTIWTTFHPTTETDVAKIEQDIIFKHEIVGGQS